jgi:hypothetical protein
LKGGWPRDGAIKFRDLIGKLSVLRIECEKCGSPGQYRLDRLIMRYGVQHTIFRCFGNAELVTCIDPMILQAEFAAHQSTFWTLMELAQPQIFSISIGPHWSARGIWTASGPTMSVPESGGKLVRQHGRLANLRRCVKQISGVGH